MSQKCTLSRSIANMNVAKLRKMWCFVKLLRRAQFCASGSHKFSFSGRKILWVAKINVAKSIGKAPIAKINVAKRTMFRGFNHKNKCRMFFFPPSWLEKKLVFAHLNWVKMHLNCPPWMEKILEFIHFNCIKIHLNCPLWLEKILEFTVHHGWRKFWNVLISIV